MSHKNAVESIAAAEWQHEWNTLGIKSGLSQKEYRAKKQQQLRQKAVDKVGAPCCIDASQPALQLHAAFAQSTVARPDFDEFLKGFAGWSANALAAVGHLSAEVSPASASTSFSHKERFQFAKDSAAATLPTKASEEVSCLMMQGGRAERVAGAEEAARGGNASGAGGAREHAGAGG